MTILYTLLYICLSFVLGLISMKIFLGDEAASYKYFLTGVITRNSNLVEYWIILFLHAIIWPLSLTWAIIVIVWLFIMPKLLYITKVVCYYIQEINVWK